MVKYFYRRRYYPRYRKKKNRDQYLKAKIEFMDTIAWPNTQVSGDPYFRLKNERVLHFNDVLSEPEMQNYRNLFAFYKLYACSVLITPSKEAPQVNSTTYGMCLLTVIPGAEVGRTFEEVKASNNTLICPITGYARKFMKFQNSIGYQEVNFGPEGIIQLSADYGAYQTNAQSWTVKITFYVIFKNLVK